MTIFLNFINCTSIKGAAETPCGYGTAEYVLIIGVDGLGGVHLRNATKTRPGFRSFFNQGSFTTTARSHNPSLSGPNWGTIVTGMRPEETGITSNYWKTKNSRRKKPNSLNYVVPISGEGIPETMFKAAKKQNSKIKTYMSFSWDWFINLYSNDSIDHLYRGGWDVQSDSGWTGPQICSPDMSQMECGNVTDYRTYNDTLWAIQMEKPNLMFMYIGLLDQVGHDFCFGCPKYYDALDIADNYIQGILKTLRNTKTSSGEAMINKTLIMLTTDHGGYRSSHAFCQYLHNKTLFPDSNICASYFMPSVMEIPVLLQGPGIKKNFNMNQTFVSNRDLAITAMNALGLNKGEYMTGRILEEAYEKNTCLENAARKEWFQTIVFLAIIFCTIACLASGLALIK